MPSKKSPFGSGKGNLLGQPTGQSGPLDAQGLLSRPSVPGVYDPMSASGIREALGGLGGGAGGAAARPRPVSWQTGPDLRTIVPGSIRYGPGGTGQPISQETRGQAAVASYQAMMQAAETNRRQAMDALSRIEQATEQAGQQAAGDTAASRQRMAGWTAESRALVGEARGRVTEAGQALVGAAEQRETELGVQARQWREDLLGEYTDTAALQAQQMIVGSRESYDRRMANLESYVASGAMDAQTAESARGILAENYRAGLGSAVAQAGIAYNQNRANLTLQANQLTLGLEQQLAAMTVGGYAAVAQLESSSAQLAADFERMAVHERAVHEIGMVQLEARAAELEFMGYRAQAELLTSPAMAAYAGDITPLVNSLWEMYGGAGGSQGGGSISVNRAGAGGFRGGGQIGNQPMSAWREPSGGGRSTAQQTSGGKPPAGQRTAGATGAGGADAAQVLGAPSYGSEGIDPWGDAGSYRDLMG